MSKRETILVIDDRQESIEFLTQYVLQPSGYQVLVAMDGERGLRKAIAEKPDLIIMDLKMPKLDGIQVLQALRKTQSDIPVILMTFHGSEQAAVQAFRLGAKDYIIKPYQVEEMRMAVEHALSEQRLRVERDRLSETVAMMNHKTERQVKELSILFSIGKSVTSLLDQDRLLTRIVEAAVYITRAEEGFLLLVDGESGELYMRAARGLGEKYARGFRLKVEDSLAGQVVRSGKPLVISGTGQSDSVKVKTGYLVKSILHVPIKVGDAVLGVLSVDHMIENVSFDDHDLYLLSAIADYAAIALENARLFNQLQEQLTELAESRAALSSVQPSPTQLAPIRPATVSRVAAAAGRQIAEQLYAAMEEGKSRLSGLKEQVALFETWLNDLESRQGSLAQASSEQLSHLTEMPPTAQHELADILNSMADGVLVIDHTDRVILANATAEGVLGQRLVGQAVGDVCEDPRWEKTYRIVQKATQLAPGSPGHDISGAITPLNIGGEVFRASLKSMLLEQSKLAEQGQPAGIVIVLQNVDAERNAQRVKDSFIASVSQELRTPVTSIVAYADFLINESIGPLSETQRKFLTRIHANADQMTTMLNDLVEMTMTDSRQLSFRAEATDITGMIQQAVQWLDQQITEKGQDLELDMSSNLPVVQANEDAVYHILINLLRNASLCSPEKARIRLHARQMQEEQEHYVLVSVTDQGGGIAPQDYKRVFNRYYRSDESHTSGLSAPDVGLPIVKVLVEAQGGRIWLDSKLGEGSTFTFILPIFGVTRESL